MSAAIPEPAWAERESWLSLLEELFDPATRERLDRIGVKPGSQVLDVGAGRGSLACWLARRVGPEGRVVAADIDTSLLESLDEPNLVVLRHDVGRDDLPRDSFDLIHCRAVLVHLPEREEALVRMVDWLQPGGTLVVEDPWIDVGLLSTEPAVVRATRALCEGEMDCGFARRLPTLLKEAGLEAIQAEGSLTFFNGGSPLASFFREVVAGACAAKSAADSDVRVELERMRARFEDPDCCDCGWPRIAAWGRKPPAGGTRR